MRRAVSVIGLVIWSAAVGRAAEPRAPLRFAWPSDSSATVELTSERAVGDTSRSFVLLQRLRAQPDGNSGNLLIRFSEPRIVAIDGAPYATARRDPVGRDVARVMARVLPSFTVSPEGDLLEHREVERTVTAVMREAGLPFLPAGLRAFEAMVESVARSDWQGWVELWRGPPLGPGEWTRIDRVVEFEGAPVAVKMIRRGLEAPGGPGRSRFRIEVEYPSPEVRRYTVGFLVDLAWESEELGEDIVDNREWLDEARFSPVHETITVEMDAATMRPIVVQRERSFFAVRGEHRVDGRETRTQRFTWDDPPPAPPRP